jgi:xyloglucan-specific exo-beta-1,4-glucanase
MKNMKRIFSIVTFVILYNLQTISAQEYNWTSLPVGGAGFVSAVITSPHEKDLIYARTDVGGAYRWIEADQSWTPITDWIPESSAGYMGIESLAIDPQAPNKVYIYCGTSYWNNGKSAIAYSEDYGETWTELANVTSKFPAHGNDYGRQSGERLVVDPNLGTTLLCGSRTKGLWKSTDGGSSWNRIGQSNFPDNQKISFVQFVPSNETSGTPTSTLYVGILNSGSENLFVSNDNGETWNSVEGQITNYMPHRCLLSNGKLYIAYSDSEGPGTSGNGAVYKLNLSTKEWSDISPLTASFGDISVDTQNPDHLMCVTMGLWWQQNWITGTSTWGDQIFLSTDDGATWKNLFPNSCTFNEPDIKWVQKSSQLHWAGSAKIDPFNANRAFITSGNGIYTTSNLWDSKPIWRMALKGLEETVPLELASVPGAPLATAIGDYDGFIYHDITKYYARHTPSMGTTSCIAIAGKAPEKMVRVGSDSSNPSMYYTENSGSSWKSVKQPTSNANKGWCTISADGNIILWTPSGSKPYYTTDGGQSWSLLPGVTRNNVPVFADFKKEEVFYLQINNKLRTYVFDKETASFSYTEIALSSGAYRLTVVPGIAGEIWVARGSAGLMRVSEANTLSPTTNNLKLSRVTCVGVGKARPGRTYPSLYIWGKPTASDPIGLYLSDDEGENWVRINDDQHQFGGPGNAQFVKGDMNVYGRVYMSTVGRGVIVGEMINAPVSKKKELNKQTILTKGNVFQHQLELFTNKEYHYSIYTLNGRKVEEGKLNGTTSIGQNAPYGMLILELNSNENTWVERIIKKTY